MSAWDGHPYNYTCQQIPCTDVTMLQLLYTHIGTGTCSGYFMSTWCVYTEYTSECIDKPESGATEGLLIHSQV